MKKIRDLVIDEQFEQFVLIKSADVRIAKNGKKFIAFTFQVALKPEGRKAVDIENSINEWLQSVPKNLFKSITFDSSSNCFSRQTYVG